MIDGTKLKIGDKEFVVSALNFKQVRELRPLFKKLQDLQGGENVDSEQLDAMIEIVHQGLQRNYPDITKEELEENLDMQNIQGIINAVTGQARVKNV
ncbi:MAG: hypothetical protein A2Y81_12740 [Nitrospirae bacterium RBG_13_43_8]|nr:MAG: hypothetical protein A2Y81_12740 [Nitrospirae bacterium RBG_13_43_8]